ncbi:tyrosine-protein phosphatase [Secundilactobacillus folii]|uniref:tyrosine-protein phosphatase n=1 Tax=Secundilactobacillus folii TaxID=2678357 RepID=UPI0015643AC9|nr:tyrosine-protein phosphatase [Secundilactobacillus folii]
MKKRLFILMMLLGLTAGCAMPIHTTPTTASSNHHIIRLAGVNNARDLGGYKTASKHRVKYRRLLRSSKLANLTRTGQRTLKGKYHLTEVVDLRTPAKIKSVPDVKITGVKYVKDPVVSDKTLASVNRIARSSGSKSMIRLYQTFVTTKQARHAYRELFNILLAAPNNKAVLWHCSEGKDRTGFASALVLTSLGVPKKTIFQDYLASNKANRTAINHQVSIMKRERYSSAAITRKRDTLLVKSSYLNAAYQAADKKYGSLHGYLTKGLGLSTKDLKRLTTKFE